MYVEALTSVPRIDHRSGKHCAANRLSQVVFPKHDPTSMFEQCFNAYTYLSAASSLTDSSSAARGTMTVEEMEHNRL